MSSFALGPRRLRGRTAVGLAVAVVVAFAGMALAASPAEACSDPVDIQVDQDACSSGVAVSVTGNASGSGKCGGGSGFDPNPVNAGCISVSGTGNASNSGVRCGAAELAVGVGCIAISGTGDASNTVGNESCGKGYFAGFVVGCIAVSGTGDASNTATGPNSCGQIHNGGIALGCVAVSGTGDATNTVSEGGCARVTGAEPSTAVGCVAVSGAGSASNNVTGACGTGKGPDPDTFLAWLTNPYGLFWLLQDKGEPGGAVGCVEVDGQGPPGITVGGGHGCVVSAGHSCQFVGNGAFAPNGVISATSGSWAITHQAGSSTVTDVSGTGPNAVPFPFADGVPYTLTVGADGAGIVAAGSPT